MSTKTFSSKRIKKGVCVCFWFLLLKTVLNMLDYSVPIPVRGHMITLQANYSTLISVGWSYLLILEWSTTRAIVLVRSAIEY